MPKVLVADDNSNIQKMAANALKDLGIEVVGVANGEAAVKKIPEMRPDLILADVFMPVRDGYELCDWVKKNELFSSIPVFLLVGAFDPLDEQRVQVVKADGIIKKPFVPPDRLITVVQSMLERVAQQKRSDSLKEAHDHFSQHVPHVEETQKLTDEEVRSITHPTAAAAPLAPMPTTEPEPVEYGRRSPQIDLGENSAPAFADMLGDEPAAEPPSFRASIADEDAAPPPVMDYDIKEAQREPSPDLPPIKVDFSGESEPIELIRDDRDAGAASAGVAQAGRLDDLVTNPNEWLESSAAPPAIAAGSPGLETTLPPMPTISVEPPEPPASPEPQKAEPMGVSSSDLPGLEWSAPAAPPEPPRMQTARPSPPPPAASLAHTLTPELIPSGPTVNPYVVDQIVDKVMMQLQPQIVHRITTEVGKAIESLQPRILEALQRDVIRPLAEELLRDATKK